MLLEEFRHHFNTNKTVSSKFDGMETRVKIEETVLELLGVHPCVTLPGLGSFIYRETQAASNTFTYEIRPALRTVFFNSAIVADDGLVANHLGEKEGLGFSSARNILADKVADIKAQLKSNRNLTFGKLGNFFMNAEDQIFFFPSATLNLSHETFGLPIIKLDELEKNKPVESPVTTIKTEPKTISMPSETSEVFEEADVVHIEEESHSRKRGWIWKVAAAIAIMTLAGTGYYFGRQFFKASPGKQAQASVDTPVMEQKSSPEVLEENTIAPIESAPAEEPAKQEATITTTPDEPVVEAAPIAEPVAPEKTEADLGTQLKAKKGRYFVIGGKYMDENLANAECAHWKNQNVAAIVFKAENSSLYKVVLQRYSDVNEAEVFAHSLSAPGGVVVSVKEIKNFK
jgi:hypothetical protein